MENEHLIKININNGQKSISVPEGSTLLTAFQEAGIFIPTACGGRAICGLCRVRVLSDIGPHKPQERKFMNEKELRDNVRLSCQVRPENNLAVEIPEYILAIRRFRAEVLSISSLNYDTKEVRLALRDPASISFRAGQFMRFVIPPAGNRKHETLRSYSISSPPSSSNELEFIVRRPANGISSTYIHETLKPGDKIELIGPMGEFSVHENSRHMIVISGGSGMSAIKAMLVDMHEKRASRPGIWYFHGGNSFRDMYHLDFFRSMEQSWHGFHFVPVLASPLPEDNWQGETGLVTEALALALEKDIPAGLPRAAYLCGSPGMIDACIAVLAKAGISGDSIYFDKYL